MKIRFIVMSVALVVCGAAGIHARQANVVQDATEQTVPLAEQPVAFDSEGNEALAGRLLNTMLRGTVDAPVKNLRLVIENRSESFYTYVSGWATFYDADGVRCGEGLFKLDALAPSESAETDLPGLRLRCAPTTWRIVAANLLTRTSDTAKPVETTTEKSMTVVPPLVISIDGEEHPIQLNNPMVVTIGNRRRTIIVKTAP